MKLRLTLGGSKLLILSLNHSFNWFVRTVDSFGNKQVPASQCAHYPPYLPQIVQRIFYHVPGNVRIASASFSAVGWLHPSGSFSVISIMLMFLSSVCSVTRSSSSFRGRLRKHWKGVVRFIPPLLVNFKLSNSCQQKYSQQWLSERLCFAIQTGWIYEWTCERSVTKRCRYVSAYILSGYTQIPDLP